MAAVKAKKPAPKKLKAGQKKKVNKWLILGGVAAVAIIGAVVVRFSSASQWVPIWSSNDNPRRFQPGYSQTTKMFSPYKDGITITKGHKYRFCVRGYGQGGKSTTQLSFYMFDLNGKVVGKRALSTKSYGTSSATHCSAEFNASKASYRVNGSIYVPSGSNNTFIAEKLSIEYLR